MTLKECDQKVVAIVMTVQGAERVLKGNAVYLADPSLGNCLHVAIDDPDSSGVELLLRESEWKGTIAPDTTYGCHAIIYLDQNRCPSP